MLLHFCSFAQKTSTVQPKPKAQNTSTLQTDPAGKEKEYMTIEEYERKYGKPILDSAKTNTVDVSKLEVFAVAEAEPEFPGGKEAMYDFIKKNLKFPKDAQEGAVYLKLLIYQTGEIIEIQILKGLSGCSDCDREAIRVVKLMPKWTPAKMSGKPVNYFYNLPIRFKL
jgi:hypothetical protein